MINITEKEYYIRHKNIIKGVSDEVCIRIVRDLYNNEENLKNLFIKDRHLNNIKIKLIDNKFITIVQTFIKNKKSWSFSDGCSTAKHILIYKALKIKPVFKKANIINR